MNKRIAVAAFAIGFSWQVAEAADLYVFIQGVASADGMLGVTMQREGKYLNEPPVQNKESRDFSAGGETAFYFQDVAPGTYYIGAFHDRGIVGQSESSDGVAFSGPNNFTTPGESLAAALFNVGIDPVSMTIVMRYDY